MNMSQHLVLLPIAAEWKFSKRRTTVELWEGALLIVGGVWLVGKVSRNSPNHPVNATQVALAPSQPAGNTIGTQTDGSNNLVWGEPLAPPTPPLPAHPNIMTVSSTTQHIATPVTVSHAIVNPIPMRFNPVATTPVPTAPKTVSSIYTNRKVVGGRFIDL